MLLLNFTIIISIFSLITYNFSLNNIYDINNLEIGTEFNSVVLELKISANSGPIHINDNNPSNNWSVARDAGMCTGNGTYSDPYVIENLVIDGAGSTSSILIEYSSVFFKIINCTTYNSLFGIQLITVNNGSLIDNNCSSLDYGILLDQCHNNTISRNIANNNKQSGIDLSLCNNNSILENTAFNNTDGIYISGNNNSILYNHANNNRMNGITGFGDNILFANNSLINNRFSGITFNGVNITLRDNNMIKCGVQFWGSLAQYSTYDIDTSNLVNNKPIYYYYNETDLGQDDFLNAGQIYLVRCNNSLISYANVSYCSTGIYLHYSDNNVITGNIADHNYYMGIYLIYSHNNEIVNNSANDNLGGLLSIYSNNNLLSGNRVLNSKYYGIVIIGDNNTITENKIYNNDVGIIFEYWSHSNLVYLNCFINNNQSAVDEGFSNRWDNGVKGNYWDDYTGLDLNYDGIGDIPYFISIDRPISIDRFPLMKCPFLEWRIIPGYNLLYIFVVLVIGLFILRKKIKKSLK
jgi:parallel beta-helix repeat protein